MRTVPENWRFWLMAIIAVAALMLGTLQLSLPLKPIVQAVVPFVSSAEKEAGSVAAAAALTYASTRAINSALSLTQEVEFQLSFLGSGAAVSPFKVLEPLDDMIERVSQVLFFLTVTATLMAVGFKPVVTLSCFVLGIGLAGCGASGLTGIRKFHSIFRRLATLGGLGMVLPIAFVAATALGNLMVGSQLEAAKARLSGVAVKVEANEIESGIESESDSDPKREENDTGGYFDSFSKSLEGFFEGFSGPVGSVQGYWNKMNVLIAEADTLIEAALTTVALYLLKTLLIPFLFMWVVLRFLNLLLRPSTE